MKSSYLCLGGNSITFTELNASLSGPKTKWTLPFFLFLNAFMDLHIFAYKHDDFIYEAYLYKLKSR